MGLEWECTANGINLISRSPAYSLIFNFLAASLAYSMADLDLHALLSLAQPLKMM